MLQINLIYYKNKDFKNKQLFKNTCYLTKINSIAAINILEKGKIWKEKAI